MMLSHSKAAYNHRRCLNGATCGLGPASTHTASSCMVPSHLKQGFEAKGWMVYKEWLAKHDAFFQMQGDGASSSSSGPGSAETLELLLLDIDLSTGYDRGGGNDGHGVVVFRLGNRWRVAQSFAF